jgi:hypothetical protein
LKNNNNNNLYLGGVKLTVANYKMLGSKIQMFQVIGKKECGIFAAEGLGHRDSDQSKT